MHSKSASSSSPSTGPSEFSTDQRPDPACSHTAGGWPALRSSKSPVTQVEVQMDRGREALVPVLAHQVVVGRRQELVARQRRDDAVEGAGEEQGPRAGLDALAGDVDDHQLQLVVRGSACATMKSPAKDVPPADLATDSTNQSGGRSGRLPCWEIRSRRSTNIDSPRGPETPSRLRRKEVIMISSAIAKVTTTRPMLRRLIVGWSRSSMQKQAQTNTMNHGSVPRTQPQAADEHRQQHHGGRDEVRVDERRRACTATVKTTSVISGRAVGDRHLPTQAQGPAAPGAPMTVRHSVPRSVWKSSCPGPARPDSGRAPSGLRSV